MPPASIEAAIQALFETRIITQAGTPSIYTSQPDIFSFLLIESAWLSETENRILLAR